MAKSLRSVGKLLLDSTVEYSTVNAAVNIAAEGARMLSEGTAGLAGTGDAKASRTLVEQA